MRIMPGRFVPVVLLASAAGHEGRGSSVLGRVVLVAVAVAAVSAFAVLQVLARSRRRSIATGARRPREVYDWRTLPPKDERDPARGAMPLAGREDYGPLWRYGAPRAYGRDHDAGYDRRYGPAHDLSQGPGYGPGGRLPWDIPDDAPRDGWA
jgi:hypothetical protein